MAKSNYEKVKALLGEVQDRQKAVGENITDQNKALKDGTKELQAQLAIEGKLLDAGKKILKEAEYRSIAEKNAAIAMREQTAHTSELQTGYNKLATIMKEQAAQADKLSVFAKEKAPFEDDIADAMQLQRDMTSDITQAEKDLSKLLTKSGRLRKGASQVEADKLKTLIAEKVEMKEMATDSVKFLTKAQATQQTLDRTEKVMGGVGKIFGKSAQDIADMGKNIQAMMNPMVAGFAAAAFVIGGIVKAFKALNGATREFQATTGLTGDQIDGMQESFKELTGETLMAGGSLEDVGKSAAALYNTFQNSLMVNKENVKFVNDLAVRLGVGHEAGAGLLKTFNAMGISSTANAKTIAESAESLAKASGVAPKQVLEDMAKASGEAAGFFRGNVQNLMKAAVFARKTGIEMTTMASQADKLLNFESSIAAEMEASVLLGRQLNFDKARQLALEGDLAGASQAVLDQVGGLDQFNKLNIIQKRALAAAAGLELDQLQSQLVAADQRSKMSADEIAKLEKQAEKQASVRTEFDKLKGSMEGALMEAFLPIAQYLTEFIKTMGGAEALGKKLVNVFRLLGLVISIAGISFATYFSAKGISSAIKAVRGVSDAVKGIEKTSKKTTKGGGIMQKILGGKGGGTKLMKGAAALLIVSAALFVTAKALQQFAGVQWKTIGMASVMLLVLVGAVAAIGAIMMSGVGAVAILAGAAALLILSVSLMAMGKALSLAGPGMESFGKMAKSAFEGIATIITAVGDTIVKIINQIGTEIERLSAIGGARLLAVAGGITALGVALAAYGGGSVLAGIGQFIGNLLGGDPVKRFERFAATADGLTEAAKGVAALGEHLENYDFDVGNINRAASGFSRLARSINEANRAARGGGVLGAIKGFIGIGGVDVNKYGDGGIITKPEMAVVGEKGPEAIIPLDDLANYTATVEMGPVVEAINGLKQQMAEIQVNIDGQKAGEMILRASPNGMG